MTLTVLGRLRTIRPDDAEREVKLSSAGPWRQRRSQNVDRETSPADVYPIVQRGRRRSGGRCRGGSVGAAHVHQGREARSHGRRRPGEARGGTKPATVKELLTEVPGTLMDRSPGYRRRGRRCDGALVTRMIGRRARMTRIRALRHVGLSGRWFEARDRHKGRPLIGAKGATG